VTVAPLTTPIVTLQGDMEFREEANAVSGDESEFALVFSLGRGMWTRLSDDDRYLEESGELTFPGECAGDCFFNKWTWFYKGADGADTDASAGRVHRS